jgi:O-antigen ligase
MSISMGLILVDVASNITTLRRLTLILLLTGAASAGIGILLWIMPDASAEAMLNRLGRIGYPVGGVIHYRQDGVSIGVERAIGTWIEPNAFAGFLLIVGSLSGAQLFSKNPVTGWRWMAFAVFGVIGLALFLSNSRGAALGLVAAVGLIGVLRDRRLIWLGIAALIIAPFFPPTREFIDKIVAGLTASDLETQMRLGEYQDALTLINRYPVFGVGFTGVPDIDLYVAFSSTYLTIAAQAGFVGLFAFMGVMLSVIGWGFRWWPEIKLDPLLSDVWLGLLAGILGALIGGIFDHFYFNPQFQATSMILWSFIGLFLAATRIAWERAQHV